MKTLYNKITVLSLFLYTDHIKIERILTLITVVTFSDIMEREAPEY